MKHKRTTTARGWQYKHRFYSIIRAFKIKNKYLFGEKRGKLSSRAKTAIKSTLTKIVRKDQIHYVLCYRFKIN